MGGDVKGQSGLCKDAYPAQVLTFPLNLWFEVSVVPLWVFQRDE